MYFEAQFSDNGRQKPHAFCRFISWNWSRHDLCRSSTQADPPPSTRGDGKAGGEQPLNVPPGKGGGGGRADDGIVDGGVGVDPWVASQVDPFMSSLREALLRDRPADVPAYAFAFSADRQNQGHREK